MRIPVLVVMFAFVFMCVRAGAQEWERCYSGTANIRCVIAIPRAAKPDMVCAGTDDGGVVMSDDGGIHWEYGRCSSGYGGRVRALCFDERTHFYYAAAENGIYRREDAAGAWRRVWKSAGATGYSALLATPDGIYAVSDAGMMFSRDGKSWRRQETSFTPVALAYSSPCARLFAVSANAVYGKRVPGGTWERLYTVAAGSEIAADSPEEVTCADVPGGGETALTAAVAADERGQVIAAFAGRVFSSGDSGRRWETLPSSGISGEVRQLVCRGTRIYALTRRGMYVYAAARWEELSEGLAGARVNGAGHGSSLMFVAADRGIFRLREGGEPSARHGGASPVARYLTDEPGIGEVQRAAVEYADAGGDKINTWHRQAQRKAWLPRFSVGLDRDTGDLWHWESGSSTREEDDCLRKGKDTVNWSVGLTWELGELVWNADQTGIDARSRQNAQLRADVIDEVTKVYFERIRLKMELDGLALEEGRKRGEKQLKLEETTALLDGLTGGEYSALRRRKEPKIACKE